MLILKEIKYKLKRLEKDEINKIGNEDKIGRNIRENRYY